MPNGCLVHLVPPPTIKGSIEGFMAFFFHSVKLSCFCVLSFFVLVFCFNVWEFLHLFCVLFIFFEVFLCFFFLFFGFKLSNFVLLSLFELPHHGYFKHPSSLLLQALYYRHFLEPFFFGHHCELLLWITINSYKLLWAIACYCVLHVAMKSFKYYNPSPLCSCFFIVASSRCCEVCTLLFACPIFGALELGTSTPRFYFSLFFSFFLNINFAMFPFVAFFCVFCFWSFSFLVHISFFFSWADIHIKNLILI